MDSQSQPLAEVPLRRSKPTGLLVFGGAIGIVAGAGSLFSLPERIGPELGQWFWMGLGALALLFVVIPFFLWLVSPGKCCIESGEDSLTIRTSRFGRRRMELSKIEKIFVEDDLATIFYRTKRGFPRSWMIERSRFREECWGKLGEALNSLKTRVAS